MKRLVTDYRNGLMEGEYSKARKGFGKSEYPRERRNPGRW